MHAVRVGLWDNYGGSMTSGWTRWILKQYEFPFTRVFAPELDAGALNAKYDVLVFVEGGIPGGGGGGGGTHLTSQRTFRPNTTGSLVACRPKKRFPDSVSS